MDLIGEKRCTLDNPGPPRYNPKVVNITFGLYSGTESAGSCGGISDYFTGMCSCRGKDVILGQLHIPFFKDVFSPQHASILAWTMYWKECRRRRAAEFRSEQSE